MKCKLCDESVCVHNLIRNRISDISGDLLINRVSWTKINRLKYTPTVHSYSFFFMENQ